MGKWQDTVNQVFGLKSSSSSGGDSVNHWHPDERRERQEKEKAKKKEQEDKSKDPSEPNKPDASNGWGLW